MNIIQTYFRKNQFQLIIFSLILIIVLLLKEVPYANLLLGNEYAYFLIWIILIVLFKAPVKISLYAALVLFVLSLVFLSANMASMVHSLGNLIFLLLILGLAGELFSNIRKK